MDTLKAEKRSMEKKEKRLRREGYVTGNVFGHDIEGSIPVKITKAEADRLLKKKKKGSQIMLSSLITCSIRQASFFAIASSTPIEIRNWLITRWRS